MNNLVDIKTDDLTKWLKEEWSYDTTSIVYNRARRVVSISYYYMKHPDRECSTDYPILHSFIYSNKPQSALEPSQMVDVYNEHGYIAAAGHMDLSIAGFKVLLNDYGIKTTMQKTVDEDKDWWRVYNRCTYRIFPKSDADYACFVLYLSDDILKLNNVNRHFIEMHNILPKEKI
jgi:hypothetical protein